MKASTDSTQLGWTIAYLLVAMISMFSAFFYYWSDDVQKAIFWLIFSIGCEVSIVRRNTE